MFSSQAMVGLMGAEFSKPLVANKVTHLICYKFEGAFSWPHWKNVLKWDMITDLIHMLLLFAVIYSPVINFLHAWLIWVAFIMHFYWGVIYCFLRWRHSSFDFSEQSNHPLICGILVSLSHYCGLFLATISSCCIESSLWTI